MEDKDCCTYRCEQGRNCPIRQKRESRWKDDADYYADDSAPAWWEIAIALIVMVLVIAVIIVSSWRLG